MHATLLIKSKRKKNQYDCILSGHGPGVTTLMTCKTPLIEAVIDPNANLADYFVK